MTMAQLQAFAAVARHGSVKEAAAVLGVSEPAVSAAVAALRRQFGDALYVRAGHGVALTAGGQRLAAIADEMLGLAREAEQAIGSGAGATGPGRLRVAVTRTVAEHALVPLLDAFAERTPGVEVAVEEVAAGELGALLARRRADVVLGPRPGRTGPSRAVDHPAASASAAAAHPWRAGRAAAEPEIVAVPFLRCRLVVVAGRDHPLAGRRDVAAAALAGEPWLVGTTGTDAGSPAQRFLDRVGVVPSSVRAYTSDAAALSSVAAGEGVMLTLAHAVLDALRRRTLVRLDVRGTPLTDLWHVSTLAGDRVAPAALALRRFATTREATTAMSAGRSGVAARHARAPVHTTLWSSVPAGAPPA